MCNGLKAGETRLALCQNCGGGHHVWHEDCPERLRRTPRPPRRLTDISPFEYQGDLLPVPAEVKPALMQRTAPPPHSQGMGVLLLANGTACNPGFSNKDLPQDKKSEGTDSEEGADKSQHPDRATTSNEESGHPDTGKHKGVTSGSHTVNIRSTFEASLDKMNGALPAYFALHSQYQRQEVKVSTSPSPL